MATVPFTAPFTAPLRTTTWLLFTVAVACFVLGCDNPDASSNDQPAGYEGGTSAKATSDLQQPAIPGSRPRPKPVQVEQVSEPVHPLAAAARSQIGKTVLYDGSYVGLEYPGGDVPIERGVCTDVVIRSLRDAFGVDLQKQIHEDMAAAFDLYPTIWNLSRPDRNIDHRRVPNLGTYFKRRGYALRLTEDPNRYLPGDLVTCTVAGNRPHIMVVSDKQTDEGVPLIIHNMGRGTQEEDHLFSFTLTGHYRILR